MISLKREIYLGNDDAIDWKTYERNIDKNKSVKAKVQTI